MEEQQNLENPQPIVEKTKSKLSTPQAILLAGLFIALAIFLKSPTGTSGIINKEAKVAIQKSSWKIKAEETAPNNHLLGPADASIVLVEYSDTECPFCKNFHKTLHQVIDNYDGEVAWVYKQLPLSGLHKYAYNEAIATECAEELGGNKAFWSYLDMIFENTSSNDGLPPSMLLTFAKELKLNTSKFESCLQDPAIAAQVDADIEEVKTLTDRLGTPYTVIKKDGVTVDTLTGALSYDQVLSKIEAAKLK